MQSLQKKSFLSCLMVLQLSCLISSSLAQTNHHLLNPSFFDQISSAQIVSDSVIRIFGLSYQRGELIGGSAFIGDYIQQGDQFSVSNQFIAAEECFFNYGITQMPTLPLSDGGVILGFNPFDCDYWPQGGLVKLNQDGNPERIIDFRELDLYYPVDQIVFVDSNVIAIVMGGEDKLFISRSGDKVDYPTGVHRYNTTLETSFGFLASFQDRLDILNSRFQVIDSFVIEGNTDIHYIGNNNYLLKTDTRYYSYSPEGGFLAWPLSRLEFDCVWISPDYYWGYSNSLNMVIQYDTIFEAVDTFSVANGFQPLIGIGNGDIMFIAGQHSNGLNKGIATIQFSESNPHFHFPGDIGISQVEVADTILVDFVSGVFWGGGWYLHYDYIHVEVTNFGVDTVEAYWIENKATSECGFCYYQNPRWWIDTLPLAPGESVWITLDSFIHECTAGPPASVCMTTYAPDHLADDNIENDSYCQNFSILISARDIQPLSLLSLNPNPTSSKIYIDISSLPQGDNQVSIFNLAGQLLNVIQLHPGENEISVDSYLSGMYIIRLRDSEGHAYIQRIVVQK